MPGIAKIRVSVRQSALDLFSKRYYARPPANGTVRAILILNVGTPLLPVCPHALPSCGVALPGREQNKGNKQRGRQVSVPILVSTP